MRAIAGVMSCNASLASPSVHQATAEVSQSRTSQLAELLQLCLHKARFCAEAAANRTSHSLYSFYIVRCGPTSTAVCVPLLLNGPQLMLRPVCASLESLEPQQADIAVTVIGFVAAYFGASQGRHLSARGSQPVCAGCQFRGRPPPGAGTAANRLRCVSSSVWWWW